MKGKMKKLAALVLTGVLLCSVSACGREEKPNPGENLINNETKEKNPLLCLAQWEKRMLMQRIRFVLHRNRQL